MKEWVGFDAMLKAGGDLKITEVREVEAITYFKLNGREYQTFGNRVHAQDSPLFDHPFVKHLAERENDPETDIEHEEIQNQVNLFLEHKAELMERLLADALVAYSKGGREDMMKVFEDVVDICPGQGSARMIEMIIERKEMRNDE
jgi:hypothetical protein